MITPRHEHHALDRHITDIRAEMRKQVDEIINSWPALQRMATDMRGGYRSDTMGNDGGSGSNISDRTGTLAAAPTTKDPGANATQWLTDLNQLRHALRHLHGRALNLLTTSTNTGRENTVELCAWCNEPAPRVKRFDGQPYHDPAPLAGRTQPQCWWHAYRHRRPAEAEAEAAAAATYETAGR